MTHKIILPFDVIGTDELLWKQEGMFTVNEPIAEKTGSRQNCLLTLKQRCAGRYLLRFGKICDSNPSFVREFSE